MSALFSDLKGNSLVKEILSRKSFAQVLLFKGPAGVGKRLFAEALARHLLKTSKKEPPDLYFLGPEGAGNLYAIASIRQMIAQVGYTPFEAPCKVFILDEAHAMLPSSSNALLKTLEEPPANTYIFLLSSESDKILPTILSRCQKISFFPISSAEIASFLKEQKACKEEEIEEVVRMCEGSIGKALFLIKHRWKEVVRAAFGAGDYGALCVVLSQIEETFEKLEEEGKKLKLVDLLFEEILDQVRQERLRDLGTTLKKIREARAAILQNVKPRIALERVFAKSNERV